MLIYQQGDQIEWILARDCAWFEMLSEANDGWCISEPSLRATV